MNKLVLKYAVGTSETIPIIPLKDAENFCIMGIDIKELPQVRPVSCRLLSKPYPGLTIINQNIGMEFGGQNLAVSPATSKYPGITFLPVKKDHRSSKLCVFFDMTDYLAYQTLQKNGFIRLPSDCDAVIMSDVRNFIHIAVEGDDYDTVYLYFPNNVFGSTITRTLKQRYDKHAVVCNPLYKGYGNLLEFVKAIETTTSKVSAL